MSSNLPIGWKLVPLEEVTKIVMGQSPPSSSYNDTGDGLPFYQGKSDFGEDHPTPSKWCSSPSKIAESLDILISVRAPVGDVNICQAKSCIGRGISALRAYNNSLNYKYLYFYLKSNKSCWTRFITGSTFEAIGSKSLQEQLIPLPPLETQHKIVSILDEADNLRKLRKQADDKMKELIPALFDDMFGDPVTNPKGWDVSTVGEVCLDFQNGIGKSKEHYGQGSKVANISDLYFSYRFAPVHYSLIDATSEEIIKYRLNRGDILFVRSSVKKEGVAVCASYDSDELCLFGSFMIRGIPNTNIVDPTFLSCCLRTVQMRQVLINASNSVAITNISQPSLKSIKIPIPPLTLQKEFSCIANTISLDIEVSYKAAEKLDNLFNSLMDKCMRGQI